MIKKFCRTCRILDSRQNVCQLLRTEVNPDKDYCTKHQETLDICDHCGREVLNAILTPDGDSWKSLCGNCADKLNSCEFCKNVRSCDFETNPSSLPKIVQKQIRQGNMVQIATVKNPSRIDITCKNGCPCYDPNFECLRQFNYCERMEHKYAEYCQRDDAGEPEASADNSELHSEIHEQRPEEGSN